MIKVDVNVVIATFMAFCDELKSGKNHKININGVEFEAMPIRKDILKLEEEEFINEKLLSGLYGKYALVDDDYFAWANNGMLEPQPTLVFNLLNAMSLFKVSSENNKETSSKLKDAFYAFFNLILYNTLTGQATQPKKKGRSKKK